MKKFLFLCLMISSWIYANTLTGYYLSHKDDEGKQAILEVIEKDNTFYVYGFANTDGSVSYDNHNPDPKLKGREMSGVVFVWGLKPNGKNQWSGGKIYNYANGKTYDAKAWLDPEGNLNVKASVWGFGKTLVWKKLSDSEVEQYLSHKPPLEKVLATIPAE